MIPIRVLGDRVLVLLPPLETEQDDTTGFTYRPKDTTASGLILAQSPHSYDSDAGTRGIVAKLGDKGRVVDLDDVRREVNEYFIDLGPSDRHVPIIECRDELDRVLMQLAPPPFEVQVGDCVLFSPSDGERVEYEGQRYVILREGDILGVMEVEPLKLTPQELEAHHAHASAYTASHFERFDMLCNTEKGE